jgi:hypothetical protein
MRRRSKVAGVWRGVRAMDGILRSATAISARRIAHIGGSRLPVWFGLPPSRAAVVSICRPCHFPLIHPAFSARTLLFTYSGSLGRLYARASPPPHAKRQAMKIDAIEATSRSDRDTPDGATRTRCARGTTGTTKEILTAGGNTSATSQVSPSPLPPNLRLMRIFNFAL